MNFLLKNPILKYGLLLATLVIIPFLIHTIFLMNQYYFKIGFIISCFVIPLLFVTVVTLHLFNIKRNQTHFSFKEAFKNSYLPQLIGGILSIAFIYIFFNYVDVTARDVFNYQRADINYQNAKNDIKAAGNEGFKNMTQEQSKIQAAKTLKTLKSIRDDKTVNFFSFSDTMFTAFIFSVNIFYIIISLFLSLILRTNTPY